MSDEWSSRFANILLPGATLEVEKPKKKKKRTLPSNVEAQQRALGVPADGIAGPMTQKALAAAYAEKRVYVANRPPEDGKVAVASSYEEDVPDNVGAPLTYTMADEFWDDAL